MFSFLWRPCDECLALVRQPDDPDQLAAELRGLEPRVELFPADLENPAAADALVQGAADRLGPLDALVMSHCESIASGVLDTSIESFDRHYVSELWRRTLVKPATAPTRAAETLNDEWLRYPGW